jgi:hypothetical protein
MEYLIFYSWQSDLPRRLTRDLIRGAAGSALTRIAQDVGLEDSTRLDSDTENVSGTPDIANTIYEKIASADVFVADMSIVGRTEPTDPNKKAKSLPNPNVLTELGYAAAKLGWERLVLVMNTAYGAPEELPFDLKNRRFPITYKLGPDSRKDSDVVQFKLSADIEFALRSALRTKLLTVNEIIATLDFEALKIMRRFGDGDGMVPVSEQLTIHSAIDHMTISRLLDRKVLVCRPDAQLGKYEYHWTHLGKLVLEKLQMRAVAQERVRTTNTAVTG